MKLRLIVLILFVSLDFTVNAQDDSTKVAEIYEHILSDMTEGEYLTALDYMYPPFYDQFPREMLETALTQAMNQEGMELGFDENEMVSIKPLMEHEGIAYQKVRFRSKMYMRFTDGRLDAPKDSTGFDMNAFMLISLNKTFGAENVSQNKETKTFYIDSVKEGMAILDPTYDGWKIINVEVNMTPILVKIFPQVVLDTFFEE